MGTKEENKANYSINQVLFQINVASPVFNQSKQQPQLQEKQVKKVAPGSFDELLQESIIAISNR